MKLIVIPNGKEDISIYKDKTNMFILGLKDYSINYPEATLDEIIKYSNDNEILVAVNKNMFNDELKDLKEKLIELSKSNVIGILFYDLGVLNIVNENNIKLELVWHQTHMVTNYNTCNYYYEKKVNYGFLANEITLDEILEIKEKTKMKLMVEVFGYPIMSHSRRKLLTNYLKSTNQEKDKEIYTLKEKEEEYLLKENEHGASILFGKLTNGTKPLFDLKKNNIDYGVLDMQNVNKEIGLKVLEKYNYIINNDISEVEEEKLINEMNELIGENTNFFYKKTIYRVVK